MTLSDLIMDERTAEETRKAVAHCIRATMMSAIETFVLMTAAEAPKTTMANALVECERLCVEQTLQRIHCRVIGKPKVSPSNN